MKISSISRHEAGKPLVCAGFTLIEIGLVIVIVGIIMAAAGLGWNAVVEGRRIAKTAAVMDDIKSCLIRRCVLSGRYPTYTGSTTPGNTADNLDCDVAGLSAVGLDVDSCMCSALDGWGNKIYYLEGIKDGGGDGLAGEYIITDTMTGASRVLPDATSTIINKSGITIQGIAFVLVSLGRNRVADHTSYNNFNGGVQAGYIGEISGATVNFNSTAIDVPVEFADDVILYVTANELISAVAQ
ncbi:MAG: type II secretion system GspH family protein [Proteobacteria bacterium]|nr:type II secretion system GspH family protein [Pseudomonadota bacterium]